ncbi:hypothetical protein COU58_02175 [Candidatus Pacearchaeota archaeon CG10_big_fil_rev_8_21_14_0_10_32_42]|nr:MAG: hypothetical protein COU58_02175 [Candidatus Pacearchaeota archaeon CG10_big_fil_rev_8_21_14_0_10_32_42]
MAKVLLDTSFILTCVRNKVDFYEELLDLGHSVLIPKEVMNELKRIQTSSKALKVRSETELAFKLIRSGNYEEVSCPGKYVDVGIKDYLDKNSEKILATVDKVLKKSVKNRKIVIRNKKKLELQ